MKELITLANKNTKETNELKCYFIIARYVKIIEKLLKKDKRLKKKEHYIIDDNLFAQYKPYIDELVEYLNTKKSVIGKTKMEIDSDISNADKENLKVLHSIRNKIAHGSFIVLNDGEWKLKLLTKDGNKTLLDIPITSLAFDKSINNIETSNLDIENYIKNYGNDKEQYKYEVLFITLANILCFFDSQKNHKKELSLINTNDIYIHNPSQKLLYLSAQSYHNLENLVLEFENLHTATDGNIESIFNNLKETFVNIEESMGEYNYEIVRMVRNSIEHADMEAGETNLGKVELIERVFRTKFNDDEQKNKYNLNIDTTDFLLEGSIDGILEMVSGVINAYEHNQKGELKALTKICLPYQGFNELNQKIGYEIYENIKKIKENSYKSDMEEDFDTFFNRYLDEKNFDEFLDDVYDVYRKKQQETQLKEMFNSQKKENFNTRNKNIS